MTKTKPAVQIAIPKLEIEPMDVAIIGDGPLMTNKFSEKAKRQIREKQQGKPSKGREKKVPEEDFKGAIYVTDDGRYGIPAISFKCAAVTACTSIAGVTKVAARQAFHISGQGRDKDEGRDIVIINNCKPVMREDPVTIGMGTTDLRYRPEYTNWNATIRVKFNPSVFSASEIVNMINIAGFSVGVGEYRAERDGDFGFFHVATDADTR